MNKSVFGLKLEGLLSEAKSAIECGEAGETELKLQMAIAEIRNDSVSTELAVAGLELALGNLYRFQGFYDQAGKHLMNAVDILREHVGSSSGFLEQTLLLVSGFYSECGEFDTAMSLKEESLQIQIERFGRTNPDLAWMMSDIAILCLANADYLKAAELLEESLALLSKSPENADMQNMDLVAFLGFSYYMLGRFDEAESIYRTILAFKEESEADLNLEMADLLNELGVLLCSQGKHFEAQKFCRRASSVRDEFKAISKGTPSTLIGLADVYCERGKFEQAGSFCKQALMFRRTGSDSEENSSILLLERYSYLLKRFGRQMEAHMVDKRISGLREVC
ncbi:MAG: tetratricopeptide repeat protein [Cyanobacteriota/Melainabacteria group bacterium]